MHAASTVEHDQLQGVRHVPEDSNNLRCRESLPYQQRVVVGFCTSRLHAHGDNEARVHKTARLHELTLSIHTMADIFHQMTVQLLPLDANGERHAHVRCHRQLRGGITPFNQTINTNEMKYVRASPLSTAERIRQRQRAQRFRAGAVDA